MIELLVPRPRTLNLGDGHLRLEHPVLLPTSGNPGLLPTVDLLASRFERAGFAPRRAEPGSAPAASEIAIRLTVEPRIGDPEAYRLELETAGAEITGGGEAGVFYGAQTLLQWLELHPRQGAGPPARLPAVSIDDRPGLSHRGYLLDVSRNRVPTMEYLFLLVDQLASLKLNQLQLYTEHTFAYQGHEEVWRHASPMTAEEVRRLEAYCRARFIELVPNQNSFGHLHRWLRHEPYRHLAECPQGVRHPFGDQVEPFSLCPLDPGSVELLRDLYDQLLPQFTSRQFNVGCDETFDLGRGRSAEAVEQHGVGAVYLEFLRRVHRLVTERGRRMQFWGDMVAAHPELLAQVPGDAVVLEWGYEADHPFAERAARLAEARLDFYLCPGTSSWNSFAGRLDNALGNLARAARAGAETGALGYLVTDWGDFGHLQPPPVSWPGLLAGAAFAWNPATATGARALPLAALLDRLAGSEAPPGTGAVIELLGNAYRETGVLPRNASALFKLVVFAGRSLEDAGLGDLDRDGLERARQRVAAATDRLAGLGARGGEGARVQGELDWVARLLDFACRLGLARLEEAAAESVGALPPHRRRELAGLLEPLIDSLRPLWLARSRPGGLEDSLDHLHRVRRLLR